MQAEASRRGGDRDKEKRMKTRSQSSKKSAAAIAAVGLAAIVAAGVCLGAVFSKGPAEPTIVEDFGQQMQVTPSGKDNGYIALASYTMQNAAGKTVQQITATVTPPEATNAVVDWSIDWGTANGSWGTGSKGDIGDYLTITPTSDGALTAQVECLAPFGTQAIITANIRGYEDISDTCTVDYVQKYEDVTANFNFTNTTSSKNISWQLGTSTTVTAKFPDADNFSDLTSYTGKSHSATATYSDVYTRTSGASGVTISLAYTQTYVNALAEAGITKTANNYTTIGSGSSNTASVSKSISEILGLNGESVTASEWDAYRTYLIEHSSTNMLMIKIEVSSKAGQEGGSKTYNLRFSNVGSLAGDIELPDGIEF